MADRPLREWPLEQLAEQAALHAGDRVTLETLAHEARHRRGVRAKALEGRLARMIADAPAPVPMPEADPEKRLRALLDLAAREIVALRARLAALEGTEEAGPHRHVHLTADAPAWLVAAVRQAFRRRYHPDMAPDPLHRRRSEEVFKRVESVFEAIAQSRRQDL